MAHTYDYKLLLETGFLDDIDFELAAEKVRTLWFMYCLSTMMVVASAYMKIWTRGVRNAHQSSIKNFTLA